MVEQKLSVLGEELTAISFNDMSDYVQNLELLQDIQSFQDKMSVIGNVMQ